MPRTVLVILAAAAALALTLVVRDAYLLSLISWIAIGALTAASMRLVLLFGELNFATAAFVGIGAYAAAVASVELSMPFLLALLLAGILAAVLSIAFGFVTLRAKGPYFKLIGFAFAEVVRICYSQSRTLGGNSGIVGIFPPMAIEQWFPTFVMAVVIALLVAMYAVEKSDFGNLLSAIKDNDAVVQTVGINVHLVKIACFAMASFVAGIAGALQAYTNNVISPGDFTFFVSVFALAYLKIGGEHSVFGPIVGAIILVIIGSIALTYGSGELVIYGGAIVFGVLFMPRGIVGLAESLWKKLTGSPKQAVQPAGRAAGKPAEVNAR